MEVEIELMVKSDKGKYLNSHICKGVLFDVIINNYPGEISELTFNKGICDCYDMGSKDEIINFDILSIDSKEEVILSNAIKLTNIYPNFYEGGVCIEFESI